MASQPKFIIEKSRNEKFFWSLVNRNGQSLLISQKYNSKASCKNGIESVRINARIQSRFERLRTRNGKHHFNLKARNGIIIGSSQKFSDSKYMNNAIKNVTTISILSRVFDLS